MTDGTEEQWAALARLLSGDGTKVDLDGFAKDFRDNHLSPEQMRITTALWLDVSLQRLIAGDAPGEVFKIPKKRGPSVSVQLSHLEARAF